MRATHVGAVASSFGRAFVPASSALAGSIYGCPACGAARRSEHDARPAVDLSPSGLAFRCHHCAVTGDALDYASWALADRAFAALDPARRREVCTFCTRLLGPAPPGQRTRSPRPRAAPAREAPHEHEGSGGAVRMSAALAALWAACGRVDTDDEVASFLQAVELPETEPGERLAIVPGAVADLDLARALPRGALPVAAAHVLADAGLSSAHRLVVPQYDARGRLRALLAHRVREHASAHERLIGSRTATSWLLADGLARHLLTRGARPAWWPLDGALRILVCDGTLAFLALASGPSRAARWSEADETAPGVLALDPSAWTQALTDRLPDGCTLVLASPALTREKMARAIKPTLRARYVDGRLRIEHPPA